MSLILQHAYIQPCDRSSLHTGAMHLTSPFMSFNLFSATSRPGAHVGILLKSAEEYRWKRYVTRLSASRWRDQEVSAATKLNNRLCEIYDRADFPRDLKKKNRACAGHAHYGEFHACHNANPI